MEHAEVVRRMVLFDKGDARRIQHFLKVYMFAALIGKMEGLPPEQQAILEIAAILHDIGIIPAEKKYGFNNGKLQEQEGPAYARALLQEAGGYPPELIDRVCFLIAHHHTYEGVDGPDWQIHYRVCGVLLFAKNLSHLFQSCRVLNQNDTGSFHFFQGGLRCIGRDTAAGCFI